jgi:hypothetical protein
MPPPNGKKPSLFQQIKATADKADKKPKSGTTTSRYDENKRKHMLDTASEEARLRPNSATVNRGLLTAMAVDEAYKAYREAVTLLRAALGGSGAPLKDAQKRYDDLRALKTTVDEDVAADPNQAHPSIGKLTAAADGVIREAKRAKRA